MLCSFSPLQQEPGSLFENLHGVQQQAEAFCSSSTLASLSKFLKERASKQTKILKALKCIYHAKTIDSTYVCLECACEHSQGKCFGAEDLQTIAEKQLHGTFQPFNKLLLLLSACWSRAASGSPLEKPGQGTLALLCCPFPLLSHQVVFYSKFHKERRQTGCSPLEMSVFS